MMPIDYIADEDDDGTHHVIDTNCSNYYLFYFAKRLCIAKYSKSEFIIFRVYLVSNAVFFSKEVRLFTFLVPVILFPKASSVTLYGS